MVRLALVALLAVSSANADTASPLRVLGHKVPDTDAVCAALAYTWELESRGIPAKAYRLGTLNKETSYVLEQLGFEEPPLLETLEKGASGTHAHAPHARPA